MVRCICDAQERNNVEKYLRTVCVVLNFVGAPAAAYHVSSIACKSHKVNDKKGEANHADVQVLDMPHFSERPDNLDQGLVEVVVEQNQRPQQAVDP